MRLIPPTVYLDAPSHAERKVAALLSEICSDDGVAYHSVRLPRHRKKVLGEVDFVVLWKGTVLVLEVKGGRIGRSEKGRWYSTDRGGNQHPLRRSPWVQARQTAGALLNVLTRQPEDRRWPFTYAVVTPDQTLPPDTEGVPHQHIGSEQMNPAGMERSLDALASLARTPPDGSDHPEHPLHQDRRPAGELPMDLSHLHRELDAMCTIPDTKTLTGRNTVTTTNG